MESLEQIIYSPLQDEDCNDVTGWKKDTVNYASCNKGKIESKIRSVAKGFRKFNLQSADVEDIYQEVLVYLYNNDDYNIAKAIEWSSTGKMVSLEGYLNSCVKNCVMRYCHDLNKREKEEIPDTVISKNDDDKDTSLFDTVTDTNCDDDLDYLMFDLESLCKSCEPVRYRYGPDTDIYLIMYVKLLTEGIHNDEESHDDAYYNTLSILNISKKDINKIDKTCEDSVIVAFAKAISLTGFKEAVKILEKYVYSAKTIKSIVMSQL